MKSSASPRRPVRKQVRLDLRRNAPPPPPEDELATRRNRNFWTWFSVIAVLHVLVFIGLALFFHDQPVPPPDQVISLEPIGVIAHGTPGAQSAPKVGASTSAPVHHRHHPPPPVPTPPQPVTPPPPQAVQPPPTPVANPTPVVKQQDAPPIPQKKLKPKAVKPPKPKIKVDLHLVTLPTATPDKPAPKHVKKTPPPQTEDKTDENDDAPESDNMGLSKAQIAAKLGKKLEAAGVSRSTNVGPNGAANGSKNPFADFYQSIHDQVMEKWQEPNQDDLQATDPVVQIHVETDGRVPADRVTLLRSSGNQTIDDSALSAAKSMGYTLQPLPDGCPPDISINFKLTR